MIVLGIFAALALVLACVGIYGVIAHLVGARTQEFAIRLALGGRRGEVLRTVLRDGAMMTSRASRSAWRLRWGSPA